jgi:hypothetical protein
MSDIPPDAQKILDGLNQVAADTLERKRRLGHYAVVWQDGRPVAIGEDAPAHLATPQGQGDYTQERHEWLDKTPLEDILASIKQRPEDDTNQYDEIIK